MNSSQRAKLRAMANTIDAIFQIGKDKISDNMIEMLSDALEARELIKGTVLKTSGLTAKQVIDELCSRLEAEPIQAIGRKVVIYRESKENKKIFI